MIFLLSDLHLSDKPLDNYRFVFIKEHFPTILKRGHYDKIDAIVILGDLTQDKDHHAAAFVNKVVAAIHKLSMIAPVIIMTGNHDYADEGHVFFHFLSKIPNIYWIGKPYYGHCFSDANMKKVFRKSLFLPHARNYKRDWDGLEMRNLGSIFAHNTFAGTDTGRGHKLEGIPIDVFPRDANVISGDIHVPQKVGPVTYIGSPYTINFGDTFRPRIMRGSAVTGEFSPIWCNHYPQKKVIILQDADKLPKNPELSRGDLIEFRAHVDNLERWNEQMDSMLAWCIEHEVHLARAKPVLLETATRKNIKVNAPDLSDREIVERHAKRHGLDGEVKAVGLNLIFGG